MPDATKAQIVKWILSIDRLIADPAWRGPRPGAMLGSAATATAITAGYVIFDWLSFIHEYKGVPVTPWNPGLGLVFAFMVLRGPGYIAALFAGVAFAEFVVLRTNLWWPIVLAISVIIAAGYGLTAEVARNYLRLDAGLNRLRDVVLLLVTGGIGAVFVAAFVCVLLLADEVFDLPDVLLAAGPLLIGDIIGIAVVAPLTLRLALHWHPLTDHLTRRIVVEFMLYTVVVIAALWVILAVAGADGSKLFYVIFLPVVVAALRHGLDGACVALAITQLGLVGLLHQYGYGAYAFAEFQLLMLVLSMTGLTVGIVVTERRHADATVREVERQLKDKEAEAQQAARFNLVSGTAAALAHEINQPLTAARALARSVQHLLQASQPDLARAGANTANLVTQIDHTAEVVRHVRDFLRRGRVDSSVINVRDLLVGALALAGPKTNSKAVRIILHAAGDLPPVHGDAVQLQQVLINLLNNAVESIAGAQRQNGLIEVSARLLDVPAQIEIAVRDNGAGVSAGLIERLFQPLATSKSDGLGLGLSISASILAAHGGRLWLHSGEAGATEFRFSLPLRAGWV